MVDDFQGHLAGVRLGDQQVFDVDPKGRGIDRVQGVLSVDEGRHAAAALHFGNGVQGEGGFTRALRAVDLNDPSFGIAAAEGEVEGEGAGGGGLDPHARGIPQAHDRALAKVALDLVQHQAKGLVPLRAGGAGALVVGRHIAKGLKERPRSGWASSVEPSWATSRKEVPPQAPGVSPERTLACSTGVP